MNKSCQSIPGRTAHTSSRFLPNAFTPNAATGLVIQSLEETRLVQERFQGGAVVETPQACEQGEGRMPAQAAATKTPQIYSYYIHKELLKNMNTYNCEKACKTVTI